jgi:hypothetical protein
MHMKLEGSIRHHGLLFVALILAFWIAWMPHPKWPAGLWPKMLWLPPRLALVALLAVQACAGGITIWYCWQYPFSPAYDAALALRKQARPDEVLIINQEFLTAPLAAFLPGRTFFLVDGGRWDTIVRWRPHSRATTIQDWARDFTTTRHQSVILIASYRLSNLPPGTQLLASFPGGIEGNESFYLYRVPP